MINKLRPWQEAALQKALNWLLVEKQNHQFLINAAPGCGKTIAACAIAQALFEKDEIDRVVVIAPRREVVSQWARDFHTVTGRFMSKVTGKDGDINSLGIDVAATWAAVQGLTETMQNLCESSRVMVICDEHHHAAVKAAWGEGADNAFLAAKFALILTGTPIRSDGEQSVWLAYDDNGAISQPGGGTYTLTYGEAVDLGYCRPVTFHRHEGHFTVDLEGGQSVEISSKSRGKLPSEFARLPGLQKALDFYRLACTPQFEADGTTPLKKGYQATMVEWGIQKLDELRHRMPEAGGLVIAPNIEMADYFAKLIELIDGEAPLIVHSQLSNPEASIQAFRNTTKRWIVSVAMISEGVDIKRLRVLLYMSYATTELTFRQAIGRVVRTMGPEDDTRAYVVMPSFEIFEQYACRVEEEMSPQSQKIGLPAKFKRCPICSTECGLDAKECDACGHEFENRKKENLKSCHECGSMNPVAAESCQSCGASFVNNFTISLDEALRTGAIVRGMELEEAEVVESEKISQDLRSKMLRSGDQKIIQITRLLPEESYVRLRDILLDR